MGRIRIARRMKALGWSHRDVARRILAISTVSEGIPSEPSKAAIDALASDAGLAALHVLDDYPLLDALGAERGSWSWNDGDVTDRTEAAALITGREPGSRLQPALPGASSDVSLQKVFRPQPWERGLQSARTCGCQRICMSWRSSPIGRLQPALPGASSDGMIANSRPHRQAIHPWPGREGRHLG